MHCPKCQFEQNDLNQACPKCGIIFVKYENYLKKKALIATQQSVKCDKKKQQYDLLFLVPNEITVFSLVGRLLIYVLILIWGLYFMFSSIESNYATESSMHLINLPFHEAGHVFFGFFGSFIGSLGGSLGQLFMPLVCFGVFLIKTRDAFGASIALWWFGQNFLDMAPYINDARSGTLLLTNGQTAKSSPYGFHDWEYMLTESGLLQYDHFIAKLSVFIGTLIMILSLIWGGYLLLMQYKKWQGLSI